MNGSSRDLTEREQQVYDLTIAGKCNKEIAAALGITTRTVRFHLSNIFAKTAVTSRVELICATVTLGRNAQDSSRTLSSNTGHHASLQRQPDCLE